MSHHIQLQEVNAHSVKVLQPSNNNNTEVQNERDRRVSSIVLDAVVNHSEQQNYCYYFSTVCGNTNSTKSGVISILYFLIKLNNSILHDRFLLTMRILTYAVTVTYVILRSTLPMWFCVGVKYLFSTGGALSLPLFMYWGFFFAMGITLVQFAKNVLDDYLRTRFLHRIVKQIISVSGHNDFVLDNEADSLQKVSFALKKYIESSYEQCNSLIISLGCVICSIVGTYYSSSRIGDILLCILVILYAIHFIDDFHAYYQHNTLKKANQTVSANNNDTLMDDDIKTEIQLEVVLKLREKISCLSSILKSIVSFAYLGGPLILLFFGLKEIEEARIDNFKMGIGTVYFLFAFLSAHDGNIAMRRILKNIPFFITLKEFNSNHKNCLLDSPKHEHDVEGEEEARGDADPSAANSNTSKKQMVRIQSKKHLKKIVTTHSRCGGIFIVLLGLISMILGITALVVTSGGVTDLGCMNVTIDCKIAPETNGLRIEIIEKQIFSWQGCVFERKPSEILNTCGVKLLMAETGYGDVALTNKTARSEEEIILEGSSIEVEIVASYIGWRGTAESYSTTMSRDEVLSTRAEFNNIFQVGSDESEDDNSSDRRNLASTKSDDGSVSLVKESNDIHFATCITCDPHSYGQVNITISVDSKRYSGTKNTISVQFHGADRSTKFVSVGSNFVDGENRKLQLKGLKDVGKIERISLTTSGRDAVLFKHIFIRNAPPAKKATATAHVDSDSGDSINKELKVGSRVTVLSGKYEQCPGTIETFSSSTDKAKVCRDCDKKSVGGNSCCGSTSRSQCWYYADKDLELILTAVSKPSEVVSAVQESYFSFDSSLKCTGSKRAGTWSCTMTLNAQVKPSETGGSSTCNVCPKPGDADYQGDAPIIESNLDQLISGRRALGNTLDTFSQNTNVVIIFPSSIYDGCNGIVLGTTTKKYKIQKDCSKISRKGVECCSSSGNSKIGYYYPDNIAKKDSTSNIVGPLSYSFGKLWVDRSRRGVSRFKYVARRDCGCYDRHGAFTLAPVSSFPDKEKDVNIQQYSTRSYPKYCQDPKRNNKPWSTEGLSTSQIKDQCNSVSSYDRGHCIPSNHLDHSETQIKESNYMINILPQMDKMNRGAWLETEMIIECLRDKEVLTIYGGAVYPTQNQDSVLSARDDWFIKSHGVKNPHYFWRIIAADKKGLYKKDNGVIAFWIPNTKDATAKKTSQYVISITELENRLAYYGGLNEKFTSFSSAEKSHVSDYWAPLSGCDRSRRR